MSWLILALDGGGVRSVLTAHLLARLEAAAPFLSKVELFAGTGSGAALALALAAGESPSRWVAAERSAAPRVYAHRDALDAMAGSTDELWRANYDAQQGLRAALVERFEDCELRDLPRRVVVPTLTLGGVTSAVGRAGVGVHLWHNAYAEPRAGEERGEHVSVVDVALRASAVPTVFAAHQGSVEAGAFANHPGMCALAHALQTGVALDEVALLSIGAGAAPSGVDSQRPDWGLAQWSRRWVDVTRAASAAAVDAQCAQLLGARYQRLELALEEVIACDDVERMDDLIEVAEGAELAPTVAYLRRVLAEG